MHMSPDDLVQRRSELLDHLDEIMTGVRELSQLLRPVILDDFGLDAGLKWLTERFAQRTQIPVDYRSNFDGRLADRLETQIFRIAQEALTNVARHSGATNAWMRFHVVDGRVRLEIEDNGHGISEGQVAKRPSLGMVGMRARARQVHGDLTVENGERGGLRIYVDAPFQGRASDGE
jgi:two-component system sensor histidine kinase UhpB